MTIHWSTEKLGNIVSHKKGFAFKSEWFQSSGVPVIKVTNFTDSSVDLCNLEYVSNSVATETCDYKLASGDVIIQTVGSWPNNPQSVVGKVVRVPELLDGALLNQNAVILRSKSKIRNDYLFYLLKDPSFKGFIINTAQGAANQASITLESLFRYEFLLPTLEIQEKIVAILSVYNNLIENNQRRIALLEKMAEEIYREWFVRLRFPGHEKVKKVKGVPEGWQFIPSSSLFHVLSGGTPNTNNPVYWDGNIPFFTPRDAGDNYYVLETEKHLTQKGLDSCNSRLYKKDTIFITARGTVGKIGLAYRDMAMNQSCYALMPKVKGSVYFHFLSMKNAITYIKGVSKSGVFDNIIVDTFKVVPILLPMQPLITEFNEIATPIFKQLGVLLEANEHLLKTRDLLLPRLISGKLSVEHLDIQFPPGMEESP